jgi:hypothetical protein
MLTIIQALAGLVAAFKKTNPLLTAAFAVLAFIQTVYHLANELWGELIARFTALVLPDAVAATSIQFLGFMNYFLPITETLAFLTGWFAVYLACTGIRMIKACIPGVAA